MNTTTLVVFPRTPGKRYVKEVWAKGLLPVNIYGKTLGQNICGAVERNKMIKALLSPKGRNTLFTLQVEKKEFLAIPKEIDIDPVKDVVRHIDFMVIPENEPVIVTVPVAKEGRSQGEIVGGKTLVVLREIPVRCLPANIPEKLTVDVTPYNIGDRVFMKDIPYPEGVVPVIRENIPVIVVNKGRGQTAEETTTEGAAETRPEDAAKTTEKGEKKGEGSERKVEGADKKAEGDDKKADKKK